MDPGGRSSVRQKHAEKKRAVPSRIRMLPPGDPQVKTSHHAKATPRQTKPKRLLCDRKRPQRQLFNKKQMEERQHRFVQFNQYTQLNNHFISILI